MTTGNQTSAAPAAGVVNYSMDALAFVPGQGNTPDCGANSHLQTSQTVTNTPLVVTAGTAVTASTITFTGCQ